MRLDSPTAAAEELLGDTDTVYTGIVKTMWNGDKFVIYSEDTGHQMDDVLPEEIEDPHHLAKRIHRANEREMEAL